MMDTSSERKSMSVRQKKNAPLEFSSKKGAPQLYPAIGPKKHRYRDPRFDERSGIFATHSFDRDYGFVHEMREKEVDSIKKQIRKEKDPEQQADLKNLLNRMENQDRSKAERRVAEKKKFERKTVQADRAAAGKKPVFLKKSDESLLKLAAKFEDLKKKGKLKGYIEKKRKKNVRADARHLPVIQ